MVRLDYRGHDARFLGGFIGNVVADHGGVEHLSRTQLHNIGARRLSRVEDRAIQSADLMSERSAGAGWTPPNTSAR